MEDTRDPVLDQHGLEILRPQECWDLLAATPVGRVSFVDAGEPIVFPVTHGVDRHTVVFRSRAGSKLEAAHMARLVAFEIDDWDAEAKKGWSVLVRGVAETVYEDDDLARFELTGAQPWLDAAAAGTWIRIRPDEVSGRRLR